ncbi:hypothetical protein IUY40_16710 [Flavobacterium sp. ALJ2]|uniref:hypothetical protein n=1 Tax=Flavobacterium sp. ALJ2 TaxID=2786960 RepID=UPI00189C6B74|nr:hypothetical protein [Flavobacterium sp. ALJ2]MBF7093175.1 hypothetical protein [Flavobacterium sp. ALJ2]
MKKYEKVRNSSEYWIDFEAELSTYYHYKWLGKRSVNAFNISELDFIKKYVLLTYKYGFVTPINYSEENLLMEFENYKLKNESNGIFGSNLMFYIYKYGNDLVYSSKLFTDLSDKEYKIVVQINPITELKDIGITSIGYGSIPLRIEMIKKTEEIEVVCYLDNDIFNLWIDNKKTKCEFEKPVDNSELAYLNTPRLNSFLRDLKKLCFDFGANDFEFENLGLQDFSENGVLFDGEVIYYEDIVEILEPHQKIV